MTLGRILVNGKDKGSGFALAPPDSELTRIVLTANHVVGSQEPSCLEFFVPQKNRKIPVERVERDDDLDVAVLHLSEDLSEGLVVDKASEGMTWQVETQPLGNDPMLTGTVTVTRRRFVKSQGRHDIYVLQLQVNQNLDEYKGYSGSPVVLKSPSGAVIGVLVEQILSRLSRQIGQPRPATNVLYAIVIQDVLERFSLTAALARGDGLAGSMRAQIVDGREKTISARPENFIPKSRSPLFQPRPEEFEQLERLLFESRRGNPPLRLGLVGMGGVGKTQLAIEFAYRFEEHFSAGIFWTPATGNGLLAWQQQFAELASNTGYLPPHDDPSHPENEARRARHFCRYLANHHDALLILDNVEDPELVNSLLPTLAGAEVACLLLYTSRSRLIPLGVTKHSVEQLPEEGALRLLLETTRPLLLPEALKKSQDGEAHAAREVCKGIGYLPLAIVHLRGLLARDQRITLVQLAQVLKQRGALDVARTQQGDAAPLFETFKLSWEKVHDEGAQRLFKLASYFPEAAAIPIRLVGLAAGLGESMGIFEPLWEARLQLQESSLLEELSEDQVQLHPLVRAFGQRLVTEEGNKGKALLEEAGARLISEFENLNQLERRARREGYWGCRKQVRATRKYTEELGTHKREWLVLLERWLDREGELLGNARWWPDLVQGLFYQQFYNRSLEEGHPFSEVEKPPQQWLRQMEKVGAEDQSLLKIFTRYPGTLVGVAFSPDGSKIFAGSEDGTIQSRETETGNVLSNFQIGQETDIEGPEDIVYLILSKVVFSFDGTRVLTCYRYFVGETVRLWETQSGKLLAVIGKGEGSVTFSPDERQVLSGSHDKTASLWAIPGGEPLVTTEGWRRKFLPNGTLLATFAGHAESVRSVAFSPDGRQVLTGSDDGTVRLWEVEGGKPLAVLSGHNGPVLSVAFSPDGRQVLSGSSDKTVRLWEITRNDERKKEQELFSPLKGEVTSVWFSPDGSRLLTGSSDSVARLWETESGKLLTSLQKYPYAIRSAAFSPDGTRVLTCSDKARTAQLWETESGKLLVTLRGHSDLVKKVAFSSDGNRLLTGTNSEAGVWEAASGRPLGMGHFPSAQRYYSMLFSPDGTRVLTGLPKGEARLWETRSGRLLAKLDAPILSFAGGVVGLAFSLDGTRLLTGTSTGAWVWEAASGKMLAELGAYSIKPNSLYGFEPATMEVAAFSPDGTRVLIGSDDGAARLFEAATGKLLGESQGHGEVIERVAFSPDGRLAISCGQDGQVLFLQVSEAETSRVLGVYRAAYSVGAVHWQNRTQVLLADKGGSRFRPHFYRLKLEGAW
jgi:WD40 repeat protein